MVGNYRPQSPDFQAFGKACRACRIRTSSPRLFYERTPFMKLIRLAVFAGVTCITGAAMFAQQAQSPAPPSQPAPGKDSPKIVVTNEQILKVITLFRQDPAKAIDQGAGRLILDFAEASPDVEIKVSTDVMPWMGDSKPDPKQSSVMLAAFFAGEIKAQLESHTTKDDAMAGVLQMIETYQQMKKVDPAFHFDVVEKWITLQSQGKLKEAIMPAGGAK